MSSPGSLWHSQTLSLSSFSILILCLLFIFPLSLHRREKGENISLVFCLFLPSSFCCFKNFQIRKGKSSLSLPFILVLFHSPLSISLLAFFLISPLSSLCVVLWSVHITLSIYPPLIFPPNLCPFPTVAFCVCRTTRP